MEKMIKLVEFEFCVIDWAHARWRYEIMLLNDKSAYRVDLWLYDEYGGYLAEWEVHKSSPELATVEAAEAYAIKEWVREGG